MTFNLSG